MSDPIIRNAQERRQLALIAAFLKKKGYVQKAHPTDRLLNEMEPRTFAFRMNVVVGSERKVNIPIDVVVQPTKPRPALLPVLIEAKSAGDFTNVNKRRKEEAAKMHQLKTTHGPYVEYILFLATATLTADTLAMKRPEGDETGYGSTRIEDFEQLGL